MVFIWEKLLGELLRDRDTEVEIFHVWQRCEAFKPVFFFYFGYRIVLRHKNHLFIRLAAIPAPSGRPRFVNLALSIYNL